MAVTYVPPDLVLPSATISFPTINATYHTLDGSLNISGTASDDRGVSKVRWTNDRGGSGAANGSTIWSANSVTLQSGPNVITVTAEDEAGNSSSDAVLVTFTPPVAPSVSTPPGNVTVVAGQNASFTVAATGLPVPNLQWQRSIDGGSSWSNLSNDGNYSGVTNPTLTVLNISYAMSGDLFRAIASNGVGSDGASSPATLNVAVHPTITLQPAGQAVNEGSTVTFTVVATGTAPLRYQWRKGGVARSGATNATLTIGSVQPADSGSYDVVVSNGVNPDATSNAAVLNVVPVGVFAAQARASFLPSPTGGTVSISNGFTYTGAATNLRWSVVLPAGWSLASSNASGTDVQPITGATSLLEWRWNALPTTPVSFSYSLNLPAGATAPQPIATLVNFNFEGTPIQMTAKPDPLMAGFRHSADTNHDGALSLTELLRVIELYNTRNGTVRTGAYAVDATNLEDGFATDGTRSATAAITLTRYHSADTGPNGVPDGRLSLTELLRVIELYNTRSGTVRTGQYRADPTNTEDGFASGP